MSSIRNSIAALATAAASTHIKHMVPLSFAGHEFQIAAPAALFWPEKEALLVADLHLEKASFYARQGQMLPPYDSRATLNELEQIIELAHAKTIFCLGDNFHDAQGEDRLESESAKLLKRLTSELNWIWITGNHDPDVSGRWGGATLSEWTGAGLALRHEATKAPEMAEISGHYHPKIRVRVRGRHVSRRCFILGPQNMILPAFGALTGGMPANDPIIEQVVGGPAHAVVGLPEDLVRFPLPFKQGTIDSDKQSDLPLFEKRCGTVQA